MSDVKFQFDSEKLVQALAFFAGAGVKELSKLKAAKLLYFADKYHLLKYGRPILGDVYFCLDHGPVPSASLNLMSEAISPIRVKGFRQPFLELFREHLTVNKDRKHAEFRAKRPPDLALFSKSELEALNDTLKKYGKKSPWDLRQLTHLDPTWTIPDGERAAGSRAEIPYELFFEGQSDDVRDVWEIIEEEQEQSAFADKMAR